MDFITQLIEAVYTETVTKRTVAIYPGRFQPPSPHHFAVYTALVGQFGIENVYIASTNVVNDKSPLNFNEKKAMWMKYDVPAKQIVQVKSPYQCFEIIEMLDVGTVVVFGLGEKDKGRFTIGDKKDGTPSYLQDYDLNMRRHNLKDFSKHAYIMSLPHVSAKWNGVELSGTQIRNMIASDKSPEMFKKIFGWYDPKLHAMLVKKFSEVSSPQALTEGGHLFGADPIEQKNIKSTAETYFKELQRLFPKKAGVFVYNQNNLLGSAFKKDGPSGDIDVAFSAAEFYKGNITDWNLNPEAVEAKTKDLLSRAINYKKAVKAGDIKAAEHYMFLKQQEATNILLSSYINDHSEIIVAKPEEAKGNMIMTAIPQFDETGQMVKSKATNATLMAQIDLNIGNLDWLKFSSFSADYRRNVKNMSAELQHAYGNFDQSPHKSEVKGAHRTQLMLSIFEYLGLSFSHHDGVKDKATGQIVATDPESAVAVLNSKLNLNGRLTREIIDNYHLLHEFIKKNLPTDAYQKIIDIFLKNRLESQRLDIPSDLVDYWKANKARLGLTGKFNSNVQGLTESGVAGGHRISRTNVIRTVEDYLTKVIEPKFGDIPHKIAGSFNLGNRPDHGDVDLLLNFPMKDKAAAKIALEKYLATLPDDVIVPFTSEKYKGKKLYKSGEIISVLYPIVGQPNEFVQIDNILSVSQQEQSFKFEFLKMPAENQGLILGLVKTALIDNPTQLKAVAETYGAPTVSQEYEYNLSSDGITLRLISYDPAKLEKGAYSEVDRKSVWKSTDWSEIEKILPHYDLSADFDDLLNQIRTKASSRSKKRIAGVFKSMITVKSGEQGTPKGDNKEIARKKVDSILS